LEKEIVTIMVFIFFFIAMGTKCYNNKKASSKQIMANIHMDTRLLSYKNI